MNNNEYHMTEKDLVHLTEKDLVHHFVCGIRNTAQGIRNPTND